MDDIIKVCVIIALTSSVAAQQVDITATMPLPPENVLFQMVSHNTFVLSWRTPPGDFDYYVLEYYPDGTAKESVRVAINKTETSYVELNDEINKNMLAVNLFAVLRDVFSNSAELTVLDLHDRRLPPALTSATKEWISQTTLQLQWTLPKGIFEELHLLYAPKQDEKKAQTIKLPATATSYKIQNLSSNTEYEINLYTVNNGIHSDPVEWQPLADDVQGCKADPCQNGGQCKEDEQDPALFVCECESGFDGTLCENNIDDCTPNSCQNDATCMDGINSFTCTCKPGFTGNKCEIMIMGKSLDSGGTALTSMTVLPAVTYALYAILM